MANNEKSTIVSGIDISEYRNKSIQYAERVVKGEEIAGEYIIKECQRFLNRINDDRYKFDLEKVDRINRILAMLNFATGFKTGKPIITGLADFQFFILHNIFCWVVVEDNSNLIREVYLEIARKNGKVLPRYIEIYIRNRSKSVEIYNRIDNTEVIQETKES